VVQDRRPWHTIFDKGKAIRNAPSINHALECLQAGRTNFALVGNSPIFRKPKLIGKYAYELVKKTIDGIQLESRNGLRELQHHRAQRILRRVPQCCQNCFVTVQSLRKAKNHGFKNFPRRLPGERQCKDPLWAG
jgi:hypothetical protein